MPPRSSSMRAKAKASPKPTTRKPRPRHHEPTSPDAIRLTRRFIESMPLTSDVTLERLPSVLKRTGLGRARTYALIAAGRFPQPIRLGANSTAWVASEVTRWIEDTIRASRGGRVATCDGKSDRASA